MMAAAEARAARGAEMLDARYGSEWVWRLNLDHLRMATGEYHPYAKECVGCVLAQLDYAYSPSAQAEKWGDFERGLEALIGHYDEIGVQAVEGGFIDGAREDDGELVTFAELDAAWRSLVEARRNAMLAEQVASAWWSHA